MTRSDRERLDRDKITRAALHLLDEVGLDGLTTRRLARWLGVQSPALYWHFKHMDALIDAVAQAMLEEAVWPEPPRPEDEVTDWLAERAHVFRRALLAHRDGARVHAGTRPSQRQLPAINAQIDALTGAGFTPSNAARAVLAVSRYTVGWVLEEQAATSGDPNIEAMIEADVFPALHAARHVFDQRDPDGDFDFGLRALIAGLTLSARTE